jgi:hypothetical protein
VAGSCEQGIARWAPIPSGEYPILLSVYIRQKDHVPRGYNTANSGPKTGEISRRHCYEAVSSATKYNLNGNSFKIQTDVADVVIRHSHNIAKRSTKMRGLATTIS